MQDLEKENGIVTTTLTPIEIVLGIDENGMTTARALYEFLEMPPQNFARWAKTNIEDNEFYEENSDWWGFFIVKNGNECKDYRLTTDFAKHLSMESHSARGKEARQYFVTVEDKAKETAINRQQLSPQMQMIMGMVESLAKQELEQKRQSEKLQRIEDNQKVISDTLQKSDNAEDFKAWCKQCINKIVNSNKMKGITKSESFRNAWNESFERLNQKRPCNLKQRVVNAKGIALENGKSKTWIEQNINNLSIIADDKDLKPAYESALREMMIFYCVNSSAVGF